MTCKTLAQDIDASLSAASNAASDNFVFTRNGTAYKIPFSSMSSSLGVTGTIASSGSPTSVSILNKPANGYNYIRGIAPSQGITATVDSYGSIAIKTNFVNDATGTALIQDTTAAQIKFKSLVAGVNTTLTDTGTAITIDVESASPFSKRVVVRTAADFDSPIDSTVQYLIDGIVDMGATSLTVPSGGINIAGYNFNVSGLISSAASYTMFAGGAAGDIIFSSVYLSVTGASSQVFGLTSATGFNATELNDVNFNDCTSLGTLNNYRQHFESGTGRFGGSPSLSFVGAWAGGARVSNSIVRNLSAGMTGALFKDGGSLTFGSRFITNLNCDLPVSAPLIDFSAANFTNNTSLEIQGAIITRNGVADHDDTNISPNIDHTSVKSLWLDNVGIRNTKPGGAIKISTPAATALVLNVYTAVLGTFTLNNAQHFDQPTNNQLRHTCDTPRNFNAFVTAECSGTSNDVIRLRVMQYDATLTTTFEVVSQLRRINSSTGGANTAQFAMFTPVEASENDYFYLEVRNETAGNSVTFSIDTSMAVST